MMKKTPIAAAFLLALSFAAARPVLADTALAVTRNTPATLDAGAAGVAGVAVTSPARHGKVSVNGARLVYTPVHDFFGPDTFTYIALASSGAASAPVTVNVTVSGRPDFSADAGVHALNAAQADGARRIVRGATGQLHGRMESLHLPPAAFTTVPEADGALPAQGARGAQLWAGIDSHGASTDASGMRSVSEGLSAGLDLPFSAALTAGLALHGAREVAVTATTSSRLRGQSLAAYASYQPGGQFYLDAALGYGNLQGETVRAVLPVQARAEGERSGRQAFASLAAGWELSAGVLRLSPYARLEMARLRFDQSTETGPGPYALQTAAQSFSASRGAIGLRAGTAHETDFGWVLPRLRLEFVREQQGLPGAIVSYADQAGTPGYTVAGHAGRRSSTLVGMGADLVTLGGYTIGFDLYVTTAERDRSHAFLARVSKELDGKGAPAHLLGAPAAATTPFGISLDTGYTHDDNTSRAAAKADQFGDGFYSMSLRKQFSLPIDEALRLQSAVSGGADKYRRYEGLSRGWFGVDGELLWRSGAARDSATLGAFANIATESYSSQLRDGRKAAYGISLRQPLGARFDAYAALLQNRRNARSEVFDTRDNALRLNLDYRPASWGSLYFGMEARRGDLVSGGSGSLADIDSAEVLVRDDVFIRQQYFDYRFKGRSFAFTHGYSIPFGPNDGLDIAFRHVRSRADHAPDYAGAEVLRYKTSQVSISYQSSF